MAFCARFSAIVCSILRRGSSIWLRLDSNRDLGPLGAVREPGADLLEHGPDFGCPEGHDLAPALELREEEHVVHELGHLLDLLPRLGKKLVTVGSRKSGRLENHEQPCQGGPELVRDSSGEADSKLLIGPRILHDSGRVWPKS
jgi:hypothetical protein